MNDDQDDTFGEENDIDFVHLTFKVAGEDYAIGVAHVTEIVRIQDVSKMPGMAPCFRGVINLRGNIIPVLDIQERFGLKPLEPTDRTVIVVVEVGRKQIGIMVEEVTEVSGLSSGEVDQTRLIAGRDPTQAPLVKHFARRAGHLCMVLDIHQLVDSFDTSNSTSFSDISHLKTPEGAS